MLSVGTLSVRRIVVQIGETAHAVSLDGPVSSFTVRVNLSVGAEALVQAEVAVFMLKFE